MNIEQNVKQLLTELRTAADKARTNFPETVWHLSSDPSKEIRLRRDGGFDGLALEPGCTFSLQCRLSIPSDVEGVHLVGERLEATLTSLYPTRFERNGQPLFQDDGPSVAAGPALFTLIPCLHEGDNGTFDLTICVPPNQVTNWFKLQLTTPSLRRRFEQLDVLWAQLTIAQAFAPTGQRGAVDRAAELIPALLAARSDSELDAAGARFLDALANVTPGKPVPPIHLIGHSHIDMNWLWTWPDTVEVIKRDFRSIVSLMHDYPELTFSHSQPAVYEVVRQLEPELFTKVVEYVRSGRWEATTMQWVEADANMPAGEAHVRQLLEGVRYTRDLLGTSPTTFHAPDTFGHAGNLPQLAVSAGATRYYHHRCNPGGTVQWPVYWWEGDDGSRLLAFSTASYNGEITAGALAIAAVGAAKAGVPAGILFHGIGDHGGGPARQNLDTLRRLHGRPHLPHASCSTMQAYADAVVASAGDLPVHRGELNAIFEGCYTTHADTKRYNRDGENRLLTAEALAALAGETSDASTTDAWRKVLFNQFHDILDGSAIHESYETHAADYADVCKIADRVVDDALRTLHADISAGDIAVTNPLGVDRADWVCLNGDWPQSHIVVTSDRGHTTLARRTADGLGFVAEVPAFGTVAYRVQHDATTDPANGVTVVPAFAANDNRSDNFLGDAAKEAPYLRIDTPFYDVYLRRDCGVFVSFVDKRVGRNLVGYGMRRGSDYIDTARPDLGLNVLQIFDERPHGMSAWQMHEVTAERSLLEGAVTTVIESGPVRCVIQVDHKIRQSTISQRIIFYRDLARIDFRTTVDWKELGDKNVGVPGLKISFNARLNQCEAWYETPFAAALRPADGQENSALRWADVGGSEYGIAVLNDSKHGYDILGTRLRLTLLRSAYDPDAISDVGLHEINFSLLPHVGDWRRGGVVASAAAINQPLLARVQAGASSLNEREPATLRPHLSGSPNIVISALKPGRSGGRIVRLYDATGEGGTCLLHGLPTGTFVEETNVLEDVAERLAFDGNALPLTFRPWQVRSLKLTQD